MELELISDRQVLLQVNFAIACFILLFAFNIEIHGAENTSEGSVRGTEESNFWLNGKYHTLPTIRVFDSFNKTEVLKENQVWKIFIPKGLNETRNELLYRFKVTATYPIYAFVNSTGVPDAVRKYTSTRTATDIFDPSTFLCHLTFYAYAWRSKAVSYTIECRSISPPFFGISVDANYSDEDSTVTISTSSAISPKFTAYFDKEVNEKIDEKNCSVNIFMEQSIDPDTGIYHRLYYCSPLDQVPSETTIFSRHRLNLKKVENEVQFNRNNCVKLCSQSLECEREELVPPPANLQFSLSIWCFHGSRTRATYAQEVAMSVPQGKLRKPEIYFKFEDIDPAKMIYMQQFSRQQYINAELEVSCTVTNFYAGTPMVFALKYKNQTSLQFLPVVNKSILKENQFTVATYKIHLMHTSIESITCFAPVHGSYDWINSTRPVQVIDCNVARSESKIPHLRSEIKPLNGKRMYEGNSTFLQLYSQHEFEETGVSLSYYCWAPYPVWLNFTDDLIVSNLSFYRHCEDHNNFQSCNYSLSVTINTTMNKPAQFGCHAVEHMCIATIFTAQPDGNDLMISVQEAFSAKMQTKYEEDAWCNFLLFYEIEDSPNQASYSLSCKMDDDTPGEIIVHECHNSSLICTQKFQERIQPAHCTRKTSKCDDCDVSQVRATGSIFVRCKSSSNDQESSSYGHMIYFGIANTSDQAFPIYFDENDIDDGTMIQMENIQVSQYPKSFVTVNCLAAAHYTAHPILFAVQHQSEDFLQFVPGTKLKERLDKGQNTTVNHYSWTFYMNSTGNTSFHCLAPLQKNSKWIKKTRQIILSEKHIMPPKFAEGNRFIGFQETELKFLNIEKRFELDSSNQSIICQAMGAPLPAIVWSHNGIILETTYEQLRNVSWSQLVFLQIRNTTEGKYVCRAKNQHGEANAIFTVLVNDDQGQSSMILGVSITVPILLVVLVSSLMIIFLTIKLRRSKLYLTEKEYHQFLHGSSTYSTSVPHSANDYQPFESKFILQRSDFSFDVNDTLGSGHYGTILKGWLLRDEDNVPKLVALKALKHGVDPIFFKVLLSEVKLMASLDLHPNVVEFIGAYIANIRNGEIYIAVEFCSNGDLLRALQQKKSVIRESNQPLVQEMAGLLKWSSDIANGLFYLGAKNVIHGDLAARNILLNKDNVAKISDFGLSRQLLHDSVYSKKSKIPLPWKWVALEVLTKGTFSTESDVWAFGVTLWEIFSLGGQPYLGHTYDTKFVEDILNGYRLPKPEFATVEIYEMMKQCWEKEPRNRPKISALRDEIEEIINVLGGEVLRTAEPNTQVEYVETFSSAVDL